MDKDGRAKLRRILRSAVDRTVGAEKGGGKRWQATPEIIVVEQQDAHVCSVDKACGNSSDEGVVHQGYNLKVGLIGTVAAITSRVAPRRGD